MPGRTKKIIDRDFRSDPEALKRVLVPGPMGRHIPLGQLATMRIVNAPDDLAHKLWGDKGRMLTRGDLVQAIHDGAVVIIAGLNRGAAGSGLQFSISSCPFLNLIFHPAPIRLT